MKLEDYTFEAFQKEFPEMFENVYCGFDLPKGWGPLVWNLCSVLKHRKLDKAINVDQVKEKFGGLRFYTSSRVRGGDYAGKYEQAEMLCWMYEYLSFSVCQDCSVMVGVETKGPGWISSLCGSCRTNRR